MKEFSKLGLIFRGLTMGIAEVIPGVSGGTIAFITGIYKTLLDTIKAIDHKLVGLLVQFKLKDAWRKVNGDFLLWLIVGMGTGAVLGIFGVSYLLENYPQVLWSVFFGLIVASIPYMLSQMKHKSIPLFVFFIIGAVIAYGITILPISAGSDNLLYIFFGGALAISALVLPGISGSFILLIMGLYTTVIPLIKGFIKSPELNEFGVIVVFALGCMTGLIGFSRIVAAAFEKYHDITIAVLSGFMLGSLNKVWPWRNPSRILNKEAGNYIDINSENIQAYDYMADGIKIIQETNMVPSDYFGNPRTALCITAAIFGMALVLLLTRFSKK